MSKDRNDLSEEAVKINGVYLEDAVPSFMTYKTSGREKIGREIETLETKKDGALFRSAKYQPREIRVDYVLQQDTLAGMRTAMDALKKALDVKEAVIVFNGDPDYYYIGTPVFDESSAEIHYGVVGSFIIHCNDPFKYSVAEYTATSSNGEFDITYNGTYKAYPTFVAELANTENSSGDSTSTNECGFIGFVNQREQILQFGDPEETDWADVAYPATVPVNKSFKSISGWTTNGSSVLTGTQVGSISANSTNKYMYPSGYGSGSNYHGPSLSLIKTGETEPIGKNFNFTWKQKLVGSKSQFGGFEVILWNNDNGTRTLMGAVRIMKTTKDTKCKVYLYVGSTTSKKSYSVACDKIGSCSMKKIEDKITFEVGGKKNSYAASAIKDLIANEITFHFMKNGTKTVLGTNYVYSCKLQRFSFDNYEDIQNVFAPGDVLTVETKDAGVYLDDGSATIPAQYLGALGNDWEGFYLTPGSNVIGVSYSDFTTTAPAFTIKYRERFI